MGHGICTHDTGGEFIFTWTTQVEIFDLREVMGGQVAIGLHSGEMDHGAGGERLVGCCR